MLFKILSGIRPIEKFGSKTYLCIRNCPRKIINSIKDFLLIYLSWKDAIDPSPAFVAYADFLP